MKLRNRDYADIDFDAPWTDDELAMLDELGVDMLEPSILQVDDDEEIPSPLDEESLEWDEKDVDIMDADDVELVNINDLEEISGSLE